MAFCKLLFHRRLEQMPMATWSFVEIVCKPDFSWMPVSTSLQTWVCIDSVDIEMISLSLNVHITARGRIVLLRTMVHVTYKSFPTTADLASEGHGFPHCLAVAFADFVDCTWNWTRELPLYKILVSAFQSDTFDIFQLVHLIFKQTETRRLLWLFILLFAIPGCLTFLYLPHAGSIILAATKVFGLFWSTLATSILVYRISPWHPLAKYPGPLLCKLSKFHAAYLALGGKQYLYYYKLHRKYGDVVRIGR